MVSFSARWEKYLQMLLRKAEEQEKEDRENPENRTKPKPAPEKEAPEAPCALFSLHGSLDPRRFSMSLALRGGWQGGVKQWLVHLFYTFGRYCCRRMMLTHVDLIEKDRLAFIFRFYWQFLTQLHVKGDELQHLRKAWVRSLGNWMREANSEVWRTSLKPRYQAQEEDDDAVMEGWTWGRWVRPPLYLSQKSGGFGSCGSCQKRRGKSVKGEELVLKAISCKHLNQMTNLQRFWLSYQRGKCLFWWDFSDFFGEIQFNFTSLTWYTHIFSFLVGFGNSPFVRWRNRNSRYGHFTEAEAVKLSRPVESLPFTSAMPQRSMDVPRLSGSNWTTFFESCEV